MLKYLKQNWEVRIIVLLAILTIWPLIVPGYFSHHDDLHIIRIVEMRKCFADLQIPCRWAPDVGGGYGSPLFNYYNPFVYYLGGVISYFVGFIGATKLLFFITLGLGPLTIYLLGRELWGKQAGLVAAILLMFAPYRALDAYVRGAIAELFAISLVPLLLLFSLRLYKNGKARDFVLLTVFGGVFLLTHNVSVLIWSPFLLLWFVLLVMKYGFERKCVMRMLTALVLALGLSAFFILPAFFEKNLVTSSTLIQGDLDYHLHFASIKQLLGRFWGYGASKYGVGDELSMQVGWPYWWLLLPEIILLAYTILKRKKVKLLLIPSFLVLITAAALLMTHNKSTIIWETFGILAFIQFPWRYLGVAVIGLSLLGGYIFKKATMVSISAIVILIVFLNWSYFRPEKFYTNRTDLDVLSGQLWENAQLGAVKDYLPGSAVVPTKVSGIPEVKSGEATITSFNNYSNHWKLEAFVSRDALVELPVFDFPNWEIRGAALYAASSEGKILVELKPGNNKVEGYFKNTTIRIISNLLSIASIIVLGFLSAYGKNRKII